MAEKNFHQYFGGELPADSPEAANYQRYGVTGEAKYPWHLSVDRFDLAKERMNPTDLAGSSSTIPTIEAMPKKHTRHQPLQARGRNLPDQQGRPPGRVQRRRRAVRLSLQGPVSKGTYDPAAGTANSALLDDGILYVAKFDEDKLTWLPLVHGEGPLTAANSFASHARTC